MQLPPTTTGTVKTSIFYINDLHAQNPEARALKSEHDIFESRVKKQPEVDPFVLAGGDLFLGFDKAKNDFVAPSIDLLGVEYSAMGNHDVDAVNILKNEINKMNASFVVTNLNVLGKTPFDEHIKNGRIVRSKIVEKNGHKYGLVGAAPFVLNRKYKDQFNKLNMSFDEYEQTKLELQQEVNKLEEQGVNKIIMLSHIGYENDKKLAQEVTGIDIIIGGHSHDLIEGLTPNKNLLKSPDGSPVIITQAGKNGWYFGILDVAFNALGKITNATNTVKPTINSPSSSVIKFFENRILGTPRHVGTVTQIDEVKGHPRISENPYANLFNDAMKSELDADISLINSANMRGRARMGELSSLDLASISPFKNKTVKVELSEKQLIEALNEGAKSVNDKMKKPGILQASGLIYKIDDDGYVEEAFFKNKQDKLIPIDVKNPSSTKTYTVVYDDFLFSSKEYSKLNEGKLIQRYEKSKAEIAENYIKKHNSDNIKFKLDGRVKVDD